jgi:ATP-binding cassette, subfamily C, bacteriocin exporter
MKRLNKIRCVRQIDITDCGPACLATIFQYYGQYIPVYKIRQLACTDVKGTNIIGMIQAAEKLGFSATGVRVSVDVLKIILLPVVAHVIIDNILQHFVVIYKIKKGEIYISDPAKGIIRCTINEFCNIWDGVLIILKPNNLSENNKNIKENNCIRFYKLIKSENKIIYISLLATILFSLMSLLIVILIQKIIDDILPNTNINMINVFGVGMVFVIFLKAFFNWFRQILLVHVSNNLDLKLILGYYRHIINLPQWFFDTHYLGEIVSRVNDAVKIRYAVSNLFLTVFVDMIIVLSSIFLVCFYSITLSIIPICFFIISCVTMCLMYKTINKNQLLLMMNNSDFQSHLVSSVNGISTIRCFSAQNKIQFKADKIFHSIQKLVFKCNKQYIFINSLNEVFASVAILVILWYGCIMVFNNEISMGKLLSIYTLMGFLITPMNRLINFQQIIQDAFVANDRISEIMSLDGEQNQCKENIYITNKMIKGNIVFQKCHFQYGTKKPILSELNLSIPANKITVIIGPSGSGKSTIIKLIQKIYCPSAGKITLDGINLQDIETKSLRKILGVVQQDIELFPCSVFENISFGDIQYDKQKIYSICKDIAIDSFINELPLKYNTILGERGYSLSSGQRQLLALARALYRDPKILLLDEPVSHIDHEKRLYILDYLISLKNKNKTILIISHNELLNLIADNQINLKNGLIIETKQSNN